MTTTTTALGGGVGLVDAKVIDTNITNLKTTADAALPLAGGTMTGTLAPWSRTTTQKNAITSPAAGMVVYDSTLNKLCVYTGSDWETVTSS
jgi:hypothetical protein